VSVVVRRGSIQVSSSEPVVAVNQVRPSRLRIIWEWLKGLVRRGL